MSPCGPTGGDFRRGVARRETAHRRHVKKYSTGRLPPERSFHFRGPAGALNLVAHNLETFTMLAKGVDDATWLHHLRAGDISRWITEQIRDEFYLRAFDKKTSDRAQIIDDPEVAKAVQSMPKAEALTTEAQKLAPRRM